MAVTNSNEIEEVSLDTEVAPVDTEVKEEAPKEEASKETTTAVELLTEEQFEKKQRQKNKERLNRVTRVFGTLAILFLAYVGVLDSLFEFSFFGWLFTRDEHRAIWEQMKGLSIYDNSTKMILDEAQFFARLGFTILLIAVVVVLVYFITYNVVDLVQLIKDMIRAGRDITRDLSGNVRDTMEKEDKPEKKKKKKEKKALFTDEEIAEMNKDLIVEEPEKKKVNRRREKDTQEFGDYTTEQLDALLSGKSLEE